MGAPLLTLRTTKELLEDAGTSPRRSLGQNFVIDPNTVRRIARLAGVGPGDKVVEVGAGLGALTLALAQTGARVTAVETDPKLVPLLRRTTAALRGSVEVIHADARRLDWAELLAGCADWHLVANLPYNIATSLVVTVLDDVPAVSRLLVMCQREAAERLASEPGGPAYGAVSVRVAMHAEAELAGAVPATVFFPRPEVESALVRIERRSPALEPRLRAEIARLAGAAFAHRRQMLRRTLRNALDEPEAAMTRAGIEGSQRPEELGLAQWRALAEASLALRSEAGCPEPRIRT